MSATCRLLAAGERTSYSTYVDRHPLATVYHTPEWMETLRASFGYSPRTLAAWSGSEIVGALPLCAVRSALGGKRLVGLPFSHRVPALGPPEVVAGLTRAARELAAGGGFRSLELRADAASPEGEGWTRRCDYVNTETALAGDEDALRGKLRANTRQQLAQAERNRDLQVEPVDDEKRLRRFARLMLLTRRRKGSLTYPWAFYRGILCNLIETGKARSRPARLASRSPGGGGATSPSREPSSTTAVRSTATAGRWKTARPCASGRPTS